MTWKTKCRNSWTNEKRMESQTIILIERKGKKQFGKFINLFKHKSEISIREVRAKIPKNSFYDLILKSIYAVNQAIQNIDPSLEPFISPKLHDHNGKIIQTFRRSCQIEIIDEDPNFYYLKLKTNGGKDAES
ncbi:hypothetical protein HYX08_03655 [Candidatus Woesearchaeota archaeon]|nr:hypothetical protein [Candidatus Woesearchaeota archaeon]